MPFFHPIRDLRSKGGQVVSFRRRGGTHCCFVFGRAQEGWLAAIKADMKKTTTIFVILYRLVGASMMLSNSQAPQT